jgi:hypothetical protein
VHVLAIASYVAVALNVCVEVIGLIIAGRTS